MAANTTTLEHGNDVGFFGRSLVRLTIAALLAVLVLGAISEIASARPATTTMGQNEFVGKCRDGGGTTKRLAPRVVQCTTGTGQVVICDFNTSPASCIISKTQGPASVLGSVIVDVEVVEDEPAPGGPGIRPGHVGTVGGGVFQQVEPAPDPAAPDTTVTTGGTVQVVEAVATEEPAPSPAPESQTAPLPGGVVAARPVVVEFVEDERD